MNVRRNNCGGKGRGRGVKYRSKERGEEGKGGGRGRGGKKEEKERGDGGKRVAPLYSAFRHLLVFESSLVYFLLVSSLCF